VVDWYVEGGETVQDDGSSPSAAVLRACLASVALSAAGDSAGYERTAEVPQAVHTVEPRSVRKVVSAAAGTVALEALGQAFGREDEHVPAVGWAGVAAVLGGRARAVGREVRCSLHWEVEAAESAVEEELATQQSAVMYRASVADLSSSWETSWVRLPLLDLDLAG
jgi:hypothetical protein